MKCSVCRWPRVFRSGLCDPCYRFRRRHGRDRTIREIDKLQARRLAPAQKALREELFGELVRGIFQAS